MAESLNQQISDTLTRRQLQVLRAERHQRDALWAMLALLEADIVAALKVADPFEIPLLSRRRAAVEDFIEEELEPLITTRYARMDSSTTAFLVALALQEVEATQRRVNAVTEEQTIEETPRAGIVRRAVTETLMPTPQRPTDLSATGTEWWQRQAQGLVQRVGDQLMVAASLDESVTQATARIRGTSEQGFQDGIMAKARDDASRLLTTQTANAVSEARVALADANPDAGLVLEHHATLEVTMCMICFARHGLRYTLVTHEPINHDTPYLNGVPYHPLCQCSIDPVLRGGGPVPREGLSAWFRRQGSAFQDEVLGPTRAALFRAGKLGPRDLLSSTGKPLTLEELGV